MDGLGLTFYHISLHYRILLQYAPLIVCRVIKTWLARPYFRDIIHTLPVPKISLQKRKELGPTQQFIPNFTVAWNKTSYLRAKINK